MALFFYYLYPRLLGSSRHSNRGHCSFRTVRSIPDCQDPPDTQLLGGVVSESGGSWTIRILRTLCSWAGSFRTVRRISDCQDPPDTLLVGCVVSGQSGGSCRDPPSPPGTTIGNLGHHW